MTKEVAFYKAFWQLGRFSGNSNNLPEYVKWLNATFQIYKSMSKADKKANVEPMELTINVVLDQIYVFVAQGNNLEIAFEEIKKEVPNLDCLFIRLNKQFPEKRISEKLLSYGYVIKSR